MREENKNPLIEAVLKLHERVIPGVTPQVNGEYDSFGILRAPYVKQYGEYAKSRLSAPKTSSSSLPDDDPFAAEKAQVQKRADEFNKTQELRKQQDTASQLNVPLAQVRTIPSQTGVGRANTPVGGYQAKPTIKPAATGGTSAFTGMPKVSTGVRTFADRTKDVEKEFSVAKPGTTKYNLKMGSKGDEVKALQKSLGLKDDGIYGKNTAAAVEEFQRKHGLKVDRIAGDQTMSKVKQVSALQNLRDTDPAGAAKQASTQLSQAKPIGSSVQASSPISGNRLFPKTSGVGGSGSMAGGFTSPNITATPAAATPTVQPPAGQPGITPYNAVMNTKINKPKTLMAHYEPGDDMSNKLIEAFMKLHETKSSNLFVEAKKAKKLDPVGKEDEDIDNDGDKDKTDSYLHNRRKKIAAAMKEGSDPYAEKNAGGDVVTPVIPSQKDTKPSEVKQTGKNTSVAYKQQKEEVEQLDELKKDALEKVRNRAAGRMMDDPSDEKAYKVEKQASKRLKKITDAEKEESSKRAYKEYKEEIESLFSEAELAHLQEVGTIVGPTDDDDVANAGVNTIRGRTLGEEETVKRGRGRPKGSKSGSKHGEGGTAAGVTHLVDQIKHAGTRGISDGKGNYMLKHEHGTNKDGSPKVHTAAVPQKAANDFYKAYHNTEKPEAKKNLHANFVSKHFGISEPKSRGISLAAVPKPKS